MINFEYFRWLLSIMYREKKPSYQYNCTCLDCHSEAILRGTEQIGNEALHSFNSNFKCTQCNSVNVCIQTTVKKSRVSMMMGTAPTTCNVSRNESVFDKKWGFNCLFGKPAGTNSR